MKVFSKIPAHNKMIDDPLVILDNANNTKESAVRDRRVTSMTIVGQKARRIAYVLVGALGSNFSVVFLTHKFCDRARCTNASPCFDEFVQGHAVLCILETIE